MYWRIAKRDVIESRAAEQRQTGKTIRWKKQEGEKEARNRNFKKAFHLTGKNLASLYHKFCFSELIRKVGLMNLLLSWILNKAQFLL